MERNLQFNEIAKIRMMASDYSQYENAYLFAHITPGPKPAFMLGDSPARFNGLMFILLRKGEVEIEVNFERYSMNDNTLIAVGPSDLFTLLHVKWEEIDASMVFLNFDFLHDININPNAINLTPLPQKRTRVMQLSDEQTSLLSDYLRLFYRNSSLNTNSRLQLNIANNLISAIFYQMLQFIYSSIDMTTDDKPVSRRSNYVTEFMKLVHVYYNKERSVSFYASKLFISPKYLSLLVKEATGKSAARVIDEFVILEAKNMLRFSGKNIQQVAYALNFSNQSSFGKYFKHLTGMSPTDYQKN